MLLRSMMVFLLVMLSGAAQAATILVWGDSLSAGHGLRPGESWPALLQTRLKQQGFPHAVINGSVSGETSAGGRSRLPAALERHKPDILILELGANDGLRGLPLRLLVENLGAMVQAAAQSGARVLLVGMQLPPNYGPAYTRQFAASFQTVASQHQTALLPFLLDGFGERREMFLDDGIHPNAAAQSLILDNVWPHLLPLLDPPARTAARRGD